MPKKKRPSSPTHSSAARRNSFLVIGGHQISVTHEVVPVDDLTLDPTNPRIRFQRAQTFGSRDLSEDELIDLLREQPGYDPLHKVIRKNAGLQDQVITRHNGVVVEGNSRVAAVKRLWHGTEQECWREVPVIRLPEDVPESVVALLMASYHVAGKTPWRPYAQADHIYQLKKVHELTDQQIADTVRMTPKEVDHYVRAYEYLINEVLPRAPKKNIAVLENKFSHALQFVTRRNLAPYRDDPKVRQELADLIINDKIQGAEVRELDKVLKHKKARQVLRQKGFKAAKKAATQMDPTVSSTVLRTMQRLAKSLRRMKQNELNTLATSAKAQQIVRELSDALRDVARITGTQLGELNGSARVARV